MSHEILGARFRDRRGPAWHEIPHVWQPTVQVNASQAAAEVGGDLEFVKLPLQYELDGVMHTSSKQVMIVRRPTHDDPHPVDLGVVTNSWEATSYADIAKALDKLSETHQVETAGVLKDGGLMFITFKSGEWDVLGDPMESYFAVNMSMKPGIGHGFIHTPVREVCWNTMLMAIAGANMRISIPHSTDALGQMRLAADLTQRFAEAKDKAKEMCEALARRTLTVNEAESIINAAFPEPSMPAKLAIVRNAYPTEVEFATYKKDLDPNVMADIAMAEQRFEQLLERNAELREVAHTRYVGFEPSRLGETAWAAYNACTEVSDWREGRNAGSSSLYGVRAQEKVRAFDAAISLVGAGSN